MKKNISDIIFLVRHKNLYNSKLNEKQIKNYIKRNNVNIKKSDTIGMTHLMCACIYSCNDNNLSLVKFLLEKNINVRKKDNTNRTALIYSLKHPGNIKIIKLLLENIMSYVYVDEIFIHWSKTDYLPDINIGKMLLNFGANIDCKDIDDRSALLNILNNKKYVDVTEQVRFLLANGADINIITSVPFNNWANEIKWTSNIGKYLIESMEFITTEGTTRITSDDLITKPKYRPMDYTIERYKWNNDLKIIGILYDYGYHKIPKTNNEYIVDYSKRTIKKINLSKSYFKTIYQDLKICRNEIIYKPESLRCTIAQLNWNINADIELKINDYPIFRFFGIHDERELAKYLLKN
ncbi:ankyrin repeat protein [Acanthamoeba polyphaga mimivirus]|uniref:Ankyrin repeat protein n=1 Tax=Acanthamoeba polyphaga mimivirus TaxID=212035 RepID=A0A2L2DKT2_MIMIV|nr:ankyrin repeat protein [Acanthamoeba polyphaga mimivirus]